MRPQGAPSLKTVSTSSAFDEADDQAAPPHANAHDNPESEGLPELYKYNTTLKSSGMLSCIINSTCLTLSDS
jgi:hypothetical protein